MQNSAVAVPAGVARQTPPEPHDTMLVGLQALAVDDQGDGFVAVTLEAVQAAPVGVDAPTSK
jgi:hypothetical protein